MGMQNGGDLGLLRKLLREGLRGLQESTEPDRIACCWVCGRLLRWAQYAELEGVDLRGLAGLLGDLGEPAGRVYPDAPARAGAAATARLALAAALTAAGGLADPEAEQPARVVIV
jgi:hypothetical protein